ncbi:glycosyltransferase family 4 protein [Brevundimonas sp.]|uniref:glycosyltransferase family 4 protein n=1 Tax=Brevundimonas sp. TaxID=1871086 RepID=UPI0037C05E2F
MRTAVLLPPGCLFSEAQPNSMETVVRTLAGADQSDETRIFCCQGADDHNAPGVDALPGGRGRMQALIERLRAFQPDVIEHHQQVKQALTVQSAFPDRPHLLYRHNALKPPGHRLDRWRYDTRYRRIDGFVFVSAAESAAFAQTFPRLADRAFAVPNPIDATAWLAAPEDRRPVIAFAGRAMAEKGVDVLCAALPAVLDAHPDWRAVLMLNDWDRHAAWATPHIAPLARYGDRVEVLKSAPLAEVRRRMQSAAIALAPSVWDEPFGLTAIEAHAAGAALISSGRGGLREASGPHALYVDEITPQTLAAAMERLIRDPAERLALSSAAQTHVLQAHTPQRRAADLRQVRQTVIERRRTAA